LKTATRKDQASIHGSFTGCWVYGKNDNGRNNISDRLMGKEDSTKRMKVGQTSC